MDDNGSGGCDGGGGFSMDYTQNNGGDVINYGDDVMKYGGDGFYTGGSALGGGSDVLCGGGCYYSETNEESGPAGDEFKEVEVEEEVEEEEVEEEGDENEDEEEEEEGDEKVKKPKMPKLKQPKVKKKKMVKIMKKKPVAPRAYVGPKTLVSPYRDAQRAMQAEQNVRQPDGCMFKRYHPDEPSVQLSPAYVKATTRPARQGSGCGWKYVFFWLGVLGTMTIIGGLFAVVYFAIIPSVSD